MAIDNTQGQDFENRSFGAVMKELGNSTKDLIHSELNLLTAEVKSTTQIAAKHIVQMVTFGTLLVLSIFPLMAFLVIGLGELLNDRYWLSSLIVAVVFAAVGGPLAYAAFKKLKNVDFTLPHTKASLNTEIATAQQKIEDLKTAAKGDRHEPHTFH